MFSKTQNTTTQMTKNHRDSLRETNSDFPLLAHFKMFPISKLPNEMLLSIVNHVDLLEKTKFLQTNKFLRSLALNTVPWPERIEELCFTASPGLGAGVYEKEILFVNIETKHQILTFQVPPSECWKPKNIYVHCHVANDPNWESTLRYLSFSQRNFLFTMLGRMKSVKDFTIDFRNARHGSMFEYLEKMLASWKINRKPTTFRNLAFSTKFTMMRNLLDDFEVKAVDNSFLIRVEDPEKDLLSDQERTAIDEYFDTAFEKPIFSRCHILGLNIPIYLQAKGLKKVKADMILLQVITEIELTLQMALILGMGLPNDESLTVISSGSFRISDNEARNSFGKCEAIIERLKKIPGLRKIGEGNSDAQMLNALVADPKAWDMQFADQHHVQCCDYAFDFTGRPKIFYKCPIKKVQKTCILMVTMRQIHEELDELVFIMKYRD